MGAPTGHQLSLLQEVDSPNPSQEAASSIKSLWHGEECYVFGFLPIAKNNLESVVEHVG